MSMEKGEKKINRPTCTIALGHRAWTASMNSSTIARYSSPSNLGWRNPKSAMWKCQKCQFLLISTIWLIQILIRKKKKIT